MVLDRNMDKLKVFNFLIDNLCSMAQIIKLSFSYSVAIVSDTMSPMQKNIQECVIIEYVSAPSIFNSSCLSGKGFESIWLNCSYLFFAKYSCLIVIISTGCFSKHL